MSWIIESGRVGELALDAAIPEALRAAARRAPGYIADGVPVDTYRWDEPPISVIVEPPSVRIRAVLVHAAGPTTAHGLGVGSTVGQLRAALPDAVETMRPPLLGRDERVVRSASLPGVTFVIDGAAVARIELWTET